MDRMKNLMTVAGFMLIGLGAVAQQSPTPPPAPADNITTIRGCLRSQRGNYIVIGEQSNLPYVLRGVGNKLHGQLNRQVEVKGKLLPGTVKTGINPDKVGSNPSDTTHGVDGTPFLVANPETDIQTIAKKCKAAGEQ
ncbi:MAG TPA: hypothetical protein VN950_22690 [Terriglobales bacterium]|nr:hypothetical protein [Terriglobales bacterium]